MAAITGKEVLGDEVASDRDKHEEPADGQRDGGQHRWQEALEQPLCGVAPPGHIFVVKAAPETPASACDTQRRKKFHQLDEINASRCVQKEVAELLGGFLGGVLWGFGTWALRGLNSAPHLEARDLFVSKPRRVTQQACAAEHDLGVVACEYARRRPRCEAKNADNDDVSGHQKQRAQLASAGVKKEPRVNVQC